MPLNSLKHPRVAASHTRVWLVLARLYSFGDLQLPNGAQLKSRRERQFSDSARVFSASDRVSRLNARVFLICRACLAAPQPRRIVWAVCIFVRRASRGTCRLCRIGCRAGRIVWAFSRIACSPCHASSLRRLILVSSGFAGNMVCSRHFDVDSPARSFHRLGAPQSRMERIPVYSAAKGGRPSSADELCANGLVGLLL